MKLDSIKYIYLDLDDTLCTYWCSAKAALLEVIDSHFPTKEESDKFYNIWCKKFDYIRRSLKTSEWYKLYLESETPIRNRVFQEALEELGKDSYELTTIMSTEYKNKRLELLDFFPESLDFLKAIHSKYQLGLITNGPKDIQRDKIKKLDIEQYFDKIFIEGEMGFGKPDERVFQLAEEHAPYKKSELLMIGNAYPQDIRVPTQRGWKVAWIQRSTDMPFSLQLTKPDFTIPQGCPKPAIIVNNLNSILESLESGTLNV